MNTSCRNQELLGLEWRNVDCDNNLILLEQTKNELSKQVEDNVRLTKVIEDLENERSASQSDPTEVANLLDEREQIRKRVTTILEQLERINF